MHITLFSFFKAISSFNPTLFICILLFSLPVTADTKLHLDEDIFLIAVNGKKVDKSHDLYRKNPLTLSNGVNQLLVQFNAEIEIDDDLRYQRTEASVLVFESKDQVLKLDAPQISNEAELEAFNKDPSWALSGEGAKEASLKVALLEKDGVQIGRDFERELELFNETQSTAALNYLSRGPIVVNPHNARLAPVDTSVINQSNESVVTKENNTPAVSIDWLLYLYKQASPSIQQQFKRIITQ